MTDTLDISKELLLQDYTYRSESLWKSEQAGETRVQLYIAFVTAIGGGLGFFVKENAAKDDSLRWVVIGWLFAALVVGLITLGRMIIRNEHTDKCKAGLDAIRQVFRDIDREGVLLHYYPVEPPDFKSRKEEGWLKQYKSAVQPRRFGGLAHTVAAINALLVGAMVVFATHTGGMGKPLVIALPLKDAVLAGFLAAIAAFMAQLAYLAFRASKTKEKLREGRPTHSVGIVYRQAGDRVEYLFVSAKNDRTKFVLPKGHIEDGEGHAEAAMREVREEAGVVARPELLVDQAQFVDGKNNENVIAKFYLMQYKYEVPRKEREHRWIAFDAAIALLDQIPESRHALTEAEAIFGARAAAGQLEDSAEDAAGGD